MLPVNILDVWLFNMDTETISQLDRIALFVVLLHRKYSQRFKKIIYIYLLGIRTKIIPRSMTIPPAIVPAIMTEIIIINGLPIEHNIIAWIAWENRHNVQQLLILINTLSTGFKCIIVPQVYIHFFTNSADCIFIVLSLNF